MRLRTKVILLAVLPLLSALALIAVVVATQEADLARRQQQLVSRAYMDARRAELQHYVDLALGTVRPLYDDAPTAPVRRDEALRRLGALDYGTDGYFFVYDLDGTVLMHSRQPELVGRNLWTVRDADGEPIQRLIERARAGGGYVEYQWRKPSNGQLAAKLGYVVSLPRWHWMVGTGLYLDDIDETLRHVDDDARRNIGVTIAWIAGIALLGIGLISAGGLMLNISEHRVADAKLRLMARQVVQSQEDERARLARELHDGTSQTLVSAKLLIESALERDGGSAAPLQKALERLNDALGEVRGISHRLRPALLDTLGLPAALLHLADEVGEASGLAIAVPPRGDERPLPDVVVTVLFRIAQEALTNIVKHAKAARVELALAFERDGGVSLAITDDGVGFDLEAVRRDPRRGLGLRSMRERLAAVGGRLAIESSAGHGVQLRATIPAGALHGLQRAAGPSPALPGPPPDERSHDMNPTTIRLLIVDDHPMVRDGLRARLTAAPHVEIVGEAGDAQEAIDRAASCRPNLALIDVGMKGVNGIELVGLLLQRDPSLQVLMFSMYDNPEYVQRALQAGARGYVLKDAPAAEVLAAIDAVAGGGTYLSTGVSKRLFRGQAAKPMLSPRESEILSALGRGESSKQIAKTFNLSVRTVEAHRQNIKRKLEIDGQAELIKYAVEHARQG